MSYDITLAPRRPGEPWDEALERLDSPEAADHGDLLETWYRIEGRLRVVLAEEEVDVVRSDDAQDLVVGELTVLRTGLQVALHRGSASVSFPYWEQQDPGGFHRQVAEAVRVVAEETGYAAFDDQTGEDFDGSVQDGPGLAVARELSDGAGHDARPSRPGPGRQAAGPGWYSGRRRAATYLIVGAVVTPVALWLLLSGTGGTLSWVALVIGLGDLLVGGVSWVRATRRQ